MPRTALTGEQAYRLANQTIPDEALAAYDAIYEVKNGLLTAVDAEADEAAGDEARVSALVCYSQLAGEEFTCHKVYAPKPEHREVLAMAIAAIEALEPAEEPHDIEVELLPATLAALVVWSQDGRRWTAFYRHPLAPEGVAATLLQDCLETIDLDGVAQEPN